MSNNSDKVLCDLYKYLEENITYYKHEGVMAAYSGAGHREGTCSRMEDFCIHLQKFIDYGLDGDDNDGTE